MLGCFSGYLSGPDMGEFHFQMGVIDQHRAPHNATCIHLGDWDILKDDVSCIFRSVSSIYTEFFIRISLLNLFSAKYLMSKPVKAFSQCLFAFHFLNLAYI
jgi:hypothetical protein